MSLNPPAYKPQPGTIPFRAIEYFKGQPAGTVLASAPLAEALGTDSSALTPSLMTPMKHGLLSCEKRDGLLYWRLGDGVPQRQTESDGPVRRWDQKPEMEPRRRFVDPLPPAEPEPKPAPKTVLRPPKPAPEPPLSNTERELAAHLAGSAEKSSETSAAALAAASAPDSKGADIEKLLDGFTFSWRSDGVFALRKGGSIIMLTEAEASDLRKFLQHMRGYSAAA